MHTNVYGIRAGDVIEWHHTTRGGDTIRYGAYKVESVSSYHTYITVDLGPEFFTLIVGEHFSENQEFLVTVRDGVKITDEKLMMMYPTEIDSVYR